jgi:hypothetical protein
MATLRAQFFYMFGTIRRHQSWLLWVIVIGTIISFVIYFDPSQQGSGRGGGGVSGGIGQIGDHVIKPQEYRDAIQETRLLYYLNFRKWPDQDEMAQQRGFDVEREATLRVIRLVKADEAGIKISDQTVGELAKRMVGDAAGAARFETEVLKPNQLTLDDFARFIRHDAAIQQLSTLYGAAGRLVTPGEAEDVYRREHQEVAGQIALFTVSNYLSSVTVSNQALTQWYSNQMARYRTPELVRVSYIEIPTTNFIAEADKQLESVSNLNVRLQEFYYKAGTNNFKDTNGNVLPQDQAIAKIKENERQRAAHFLAQKRANEIGNKLEDALSKATQPSPAILDEVAKAEKLPVQVSMPFDMDEGPTNLVVAPNFTRLAFSLNASNNPVSVQPIEGETAYYLIALKETIPSKQQTFDEVKTKLTDDYKRAQAFNTMRMEAMSFAATVTNALATGKTFEQAAAAANVKVITLPPISRGTESLTNLDDVINVRQVKQVLFSLEPNRASQFVPNPPDGGYVAYNKMLLPINEAKMKEDMPKFLAEFRAARQNEVFNNWFRKQVEKSLPTLPTLQQKQQRGGTTRG